MDYQIEIPKLLIIAQKRSGSHFLQDSIKCASLTGVTFLNYLKDGGSTNPVDPNLYRKNNGIGDLSIQFLRYHNFSTEDPNLVQWLAFSDYLIHQSPKIVVLGRKDRFMHALTDWFGSQVFDRGVKQKNPHKVWTKYRENILKDYQIDDDKFAYYFLRANVFYRFFPSLYSGYEHKCHFIFYEDFDNIENVVVGISEFAGFDVGTGNYPVWQSADYSMMPGFKKLREQYANP
ncbi:hypothetical protein J4G08_07635 [Candidatus Poribacteria bacterium]|nr:hypothetical protein [Candidatus Poribacteria bacterium]